MRNIRDGVGEEALIGQKLGSLLAEADHHLMDLGTEDRDFTFLILFELHIFRAVKDLIDTVGKVCDPSVSPDVRDETYEDQSD